MKKELKFQNHIIESYERQGGYARKWVSEWQAHKPDLICSLPGIGLHLMEVKHLPEFGIGSVTHTNVLTKGQVIECRKFINAGALALVGVVGMSSDALGSCLALFDPLAPVWFMNEAEWVPYVRNQGFDMRKLLQGKT